MSIFVGFYRPTPEYLSEFGARARAGDPSQDPKLARLVVELTEHLPAGCRIIGSYNTIAGNVLQDPGPPSVIIVDAASGDDVLSISQYYSGYLQFQWHPARSVGTTRQEREAATSAAAQPVR